MENAGSIMVPVSFSLALQEGTVIGHKQTELRAILEKEDDTTGVITGLVLTAALIAMLTAVKAFYADHLGYALLLVVFGALMVFNMLFLQRTQNYQAFQVFF